MNENWRVKLKRETGELKKEYEATIAKLRVRLENAVYFQQVARAYISHFDDCDAHSPDWSGDERCECGLDGFAQDNHLSIELSKELLKKLDGENGENKVND